jgi:hypothetical protein
MPGLLFGVEVERKLKGVQSGFDDLMISSFFYFKRKYLRQGRNL